MRIILPLCICISLILASGCKSRKLSIEESKSVDKSRTEQTSLVSQQRADSSSHQGTKESVLTDQSGTWIWEEWHQGDKTNETASSNTPSVIYRRTTFTKNDIRKTEAAKVEEYSTHSEIKDSTGTQLIQRDVRTETRKKDLEATQTGYGWIWPLVLIIVALGAITAFFRFGGIR